jgi:hypothetical protein
MPEWTSLLRNGKRLVLPTLFLRPNSLNEARIAYRVLSENSTQTRGIAGHVCSMKDWQSAKTVLSTRVSRIENWSGKSATRISLIDPDLHTLFTGPRTEKRDLMEVPLDDGKLGDTTIPGVLGGVPLRRVVEAAIGEMESPIPKAENYANRFYEHMDRVTYGIEKFQIDNDVDIVIGTYVPITTISLADRQIQKARKLLRDSLLMFERVFPSARRNRDFMSMIATNARMLETEYSDDLLEMLVNNSADQIGIKLLNFNDKDTARASGVLRFIEKLRSRLDEFGRSAPIHLFNVMSEFAFVSFCHGAASGTVPMATFPDLHFDPNNPSSPEVRGRYYHPIDMSYDTYEELCAKTQPENFKPPCSCPTCRSYETIMQALPNWASSRKTHFVFNKSEEIMEIRAVPVSTLNVHLRDKFARSQATSYLPYLDHMYPYSVSN